MPELFEFLKSKELKSKFLLKITELENGCLIWTGAINSDGYGAFWINGRCFGAHQVGFALLHGRPCKSELELHHKCETRPCVNGNHLIEVTHETNMKLSRTTLDRIPNVGSHLKETCKSNHLLNDENSYIDPRGFRECRQCRRDAVTRYRLKKKEVMPNVV